MKITTFALLISLSLILFPQLVWAQAAPFDVVNEYEVKDSAAKAADIVSSTDNGIARADQSYDSRMFGVIVDNPVIVFRPTNKAGIPISRAGIAEVNVSTANGPIKSGDYVTSSDLPGVGQKASASGVVLGIAMSAFDGSGGSAVTYTPKTATAQNQPRQVNIGTVRVAINVQYIDIFTANGQSTPAGPAKNAGSFFTALGQTIGLVGHISAPEKFTDAAKYIVAGIIALGSFLFGFFVFARSIPKGVEAVGRNPLAKGAIEFSLVMNIIFTIGVCLIGVVSAIIIIRL